MNADIFERITHLIAARAGLQVRSKDRSDWTDALEKRLKACRLASPDDYLKLLQASEVDGPGEWRALLPALTNGESYFLRDKGQFALLRGRILPELIEARRAQRSLRLWSAGCSTGEEPYSLAMLVRELVPPGWDVSILGTDVNDQSLQKARRGQYSNWSFRALDADLRARYFQGIASALELKPELREMVRFETDNLCGDGTQKTSAQGNIRDMDLILCRNVLIYFGPEAVGRALARFSGALRDGGYLLTGHAELHHHDPAPLQPRVFPESVIYQRCDLNALPARKAEPRPAIGVSTSAPSASVINPTFTQPLVAQSASNRLVVLSSTTPLRAREVREASPIALSTAPRSDETATGTLSTHAWCQKARAQANAGQHEEAIVCCQSAIAQEPVAVEAYLIWAQVAQEQGRCEEAKDLFKKVIYLAPAEVEAYLELGALYEQEGDGARARRMRVAALDVLRGRGAVTSSNGAAPIRRSAEIEAMIAHLEILLAPGTPRSGGPRLSASPRPSR